MWFVIAGLGGGTLLWFVCGLIAALRGEDEGDE